MPMGAFISVTENFGIIGMAKAVMTQSDSDSDDSYYCHSYQMNKYKKI